MEISTGTPWNTDLTGDVLRIASSDDSPLRVLAGPGTGKTYTLQRRVARLLQEGCPAEKIFVCTYTRASAHDLRSALMRLDVPGVNKVQAQTLHSYSHHLLQRSHAMRLTGRVPRLLMNFEERFLREDLCLRSQGETLKNVKDNLELFGAAWARIQSEDPTWPQTESDMRFHERLMSWLRFHRSMLLHEMIIEAMHFIRDNPASPLIPEFDYIFVDEYQDLNRAEQRLIELIGASSKIMIIGDEDQSIYSFKYAHPDGIIDFARIFPTTVDDSLEVCRRCPRNVIDLANSLISFNPGRTPRMLVPDEGCIEGEILSVQWENMIQEAKGIAQLIDERISAGGIKAQDILVIAPRRPFAAAIKEALRDREIPALNFFSEDALSGDPTTTGKYTAQQAFTLLTLLADPQDRVALRCWCGFGNGNLFSEQWRVIREHCESTGEEPWSTLERIITSDLQLGQFPGIVKRFNALRKRLHDLEGVTGMDLFNALFPAEAGWAEDIRTASVEIDIEDDMEAKDLRESLTLALSRQELPTDVELVRVMSPWKAKGLTAKMVIVAGCVEGIFPSFNDDLTAEQLELSIQEQRRLFYVAITRPTDVLIFSSVAALPGNEAHRMRAPVVRRGRTVPARESRFLRELGPNRPPTVRGTTILQSPLRN